MLFIPKYPFTSAKIEGIFCEGEWEQQWHLDGCTSIVGHSLIISLIGHLTGLIDFIGLDSLIGFVGFIGLVYLIGLVRLIGLINCIGHNRLVGCIGFAGLIDIVQLISLVG